MTWIETAFRKKSKNKMSIFQCLVQWKTQIKVTNQSIQNNKCLSILLNYRKVKNQLSKHKETALKIKMNKLS